MCLALFAGLSASCSHVADKAAKDLQVWAETGVVSAAKPYFNGKQDKVKVHRQVWCKLIPLERFSLDCRKTKTKVNTLANQRA